MRHGYGAIKIHYYYYYYYYYLSMDSNFFCRNNIFLRTLNVNLQLLLKANPRLFGDYMKEEF